ncbi:glucose/galactose MFS transporter [Acetobacter ghanensis]|uniref:Glucose-galactose transporter n=1 Tax=Acetobacter ghanensis TaxID=431306 RepID=A0A0U5F121_9PROT|nr:glucose/galactose MFS transporter [Acetobacter ghanensis]NHO40030.1 glucose/galactose MFS transporter [Acetobacter ghanensis]GBQ50772.1 glucose/galactose transporter [Acetobacter ghanensis DSM 18895]CEF54023.1 glucose-galactose transporter [Acetobacter ghanensis]
MPQPSTQTPGAARIPCPAGAYGWRPLVLTAVLFFIIGFVTWLNGPLISFVRVAFTLNDLAAFLVPLVFYFAYFLFSIPASLSVTHTGFKNGLVYALLIMAGGMVLTGQCLHAGSYPGALSGFLVLGAGLSLLQVAINPYVSLLGPDNRSAQRIAIMGICNKLGGILAPIALATLAMHHVGDISAQLQTLTDPETKRSVQQVFLNSIYWPYMGMAVFLALTALWADRSSLPEISVDYSHNYNSEYRFLKILTTSLSYRNLLGAGAMFFYVGVEVLSGDAVGTYAQGFGISVDQTKFFTSLTLFFMLCGYITGLVLSPRFITQERYLPLSCLCGGVLSLGAWATHGYASVLCVTLLGFANSMIFPSLFPIALKGAGHHTAQVSAFLVMAYCGGGVVPQIFVLLKPVMGFQTTFAGLALCSYALIASYAKLSTVAPAVKNNVS